MSIFSGRNQCKTILWCVLFVIRGLFMEVVGENMEDLVPESVVMRLYEMYTEAYNDEGTISRRSISTYDSNFDVHVQKLMEVNGLKAHNLLINQKNKEGRQLHYIINPLEAKISNAFLSLNEFRNLLNDRAVKMRADFLAENSAVHSLPRPKTLRINVGFLSKYNVTPRILVKAFYNKITTTVLETTTIVSRKRKVRARLKTLVTQPTLASTTRKIKRKGIKRKVFRKRTSTTTGTPEADERNSKNTKIKVAIGRDKPQRIRVIKQKQSRQKSVEVFVAETTPLAETTEKDPKYEIEPKYETTKMGPKYETTEIGPKYEIEPKYETTEIGPKYETTEISSKYESTEIDPNYETTESDTKYTPWTETPANVPMEEIVTKQNSHKHTKRSTMKILNAEEIIKHLESKFIINKRPATYNRTKFNTPSFEETYKGNLAQYIRPTTTTEEPPANLRHRYEVKQSVQGALPADDIEDFNRGLNRNIFVEDAATTPKQFTRYTPDKSLLSKFIPEMNMDYPAITTLSDFNPRDNPREPSQSMGESPRYDDEFLSEIVPRVKKTTRSDSSHPEAMAPNGPASQTPAPQDMKRRPYKTMNLNYFNNNNSPLRPRARLRTIRLKSTTTTTRRPRLSKPLVFSAY